MSERYDELAAAHYAAYRPPLHEIILKRVLSVNERFRVGLDLGCGTGYSAVALTEHGLRVYGIDPSPAMLRQAVAHDRVRYLRAAGEHIPLTTSSVDIVTLAGSLFYLDTFAAAEEITRVCPDGVVIVYDFEILLGEVLERLGLDSRAGGSTYDHRANFTGVPGFTPLKVGSELVSIRVTATELAHVLLADSRRFDEFAVRYRASDPFLALRAELQAADDHRTNEAAIYYSRYALKSLNPQVFV